MCELDDARSLASGFVVIFIKEGFCNTDLDAHTVRAHTLTRSSVHPFFEIVCPCRNVGSIKVVRKFCAIGIKNVLVALSEITLERFQYTYIYLDITRTV